MYWQAPSGFVLRVVEILRIHTGKFSDRAHMAPEDTQGVHHHQWGEHVWFQLNNGACGDVMTVWVKGTDWVKLDEAGYEPFPPEGAVLVRSGGKLVASVAAAAGLARR